MSRPDDADDTASERSAVEWVHERVEDVTALARSGQFHAVVACVGPGAKILAGVKDIVSLRLVRGQSLIYHNAGPKPSDRGAAGESDSLKRPSDAGGNGANGTGMSQSNGHKLLTSAVLCGQYVVPMGVDGEGSGHKLICGATQEPILYEEALAKPPDMDRARRTLRPKISKFYPALEGVEPIDVTAGVSSRTHRSHRLFDEEAQAKA